MTEDEPLVDVEKYYKSIMKRVWTTKGCRFIASRRLELKQSFSTLTMSVLSVYVIAASIYAVLKSSQLSPAESDAFNVATIVTSVFLLVLNHIEAAQQYSLKSALMLKSAQKISEIYNELEFQTRTGQMTPSNCRSLISQYDAAIRDIQDNHDEVDFRYFVAQHRPDFEMDGFPQGFCALSYRIRFELRIWGLYAMLLTLPPAVVFLLVK